MSKQITFLTEETQYTPGQIEAIAGKLKSGKVKNRYAAKNKIRKVKCTRSFQKWLAQ